MSITSEYRKMNMSKNLKEDIYQDLNKVIKDFKGKLETFALDKNLNSELKVQLTDLIKICKNLEEGLFDIRAAESALQSEE